MKKLLSLTSKDFSTGIAPYKNDARFGLFYTAAGYNPSLFGGDIAFTKAPVRFGDTTVTDDITCFARTTDVIYGIGNGGHFYKIGSLSTTPTVSDLKSGGALTSPAQSIFTFQTIKGAADYVYYFHNNTKIGQLKCSDDSFSDNKYTLTHGHAAGATPFMVIEDRVYFGCQNYIHMFSDNGTDADPVLTEDVLDLPKGESARSMSYDGEYLIIGATTSNSTVIYFWDFKNNLDSWTKTHKIPDYITSLKTINGITYAKGRRGLWAFTFSTYPTLIREDVKAGAASVYTNDLGMLKDLVLIGDQASTLFAYGKINNNFRTSLLAISTGYTGSPIAMDFQSSLTRGFVSTSAKLYYVDYTTQKTASSDVITTSYINLGNKYNISRLEIVFADKLASGDSVAIRLRRTTGSTDGVDYQDYSTVSYANYGAVNNGTSFTTNQLSGDFISLELTISGTCVIKKIDIYGELSNRTS